MDKKQQIITALRAFIGQRSSMDYRNYGDVKSFRAEQRSITKDGQQARQLLREIELRDSITAEDIITASQSAYSGRLTITVLDDNAIKVGYCTGQYFPTEYRRAVCAVCALALWAWARVNAMPASVLMHNTETGETLERYEDLRAGAWLRAFFKREFGAAIQKRWFD